MSVVTKSIALIQADSGKVLEIHVTGKLEKADYEQFVPEVEDLIQRHGKLRLLVVLNDFHGWTAGALWEDIKFDAKHFNDLDRLAIVGGTKWEKGMAAFCRPFTTAEVRYFQPEQLDEARNWLGSIAVAE
jgi:hypothetical protein